jgi:hypothetical protein
LACRLHKTPDEIRRAFTLDEFEAFLIFEKLEKELS